MKQKYIRPQAEDTLLPVGYIICTSGYGDLEDTGDHENDL